MTLDIINGIKVLAEQDKKQFISYSSSTMNFVNTIMNDKSIRKDSSLQTYIH